MNNFHVFIIVGKDPLKNPGGFASYAYNLIKVFARTISSQRLHLVCISEKNKNYIQKTPFCSIHNVKVPFGAVKNPLLPLHCFFISKYLKKYLYKDQLKEKICILGVGSWGLAGTFLKGRIKNKLVLINSLFTTPKHEGRGLLDGVVIDDYGLVKKLEYLLLYLTLFKLLSFFERKLVEKSDYILIHYKSSKVILKEEFGVKDSKFLFIPHYSVHTFEKTEVGKPAGKQKVILPEKPLILTICRQESRKGINYLLRAIREVVQNYKKKVRLIIVGSGDMLNSNKKLAENLGIREYVEFTGFAADIEPYLRGADIFVLPSLEEGASAISLQEAMKYGLAVITTNCDGMPEDITDGVSGLLVPPKDSHRLAKAIIRLLDNEALVKKLGEGAKKVYNEKFAEEKVSAALTPLLDILNRQDSYLDTLLRKEEWIKSRKEKGQKISKILSQFTSLAGKKVLDIGCSVGEIANVIARQAESVVGIDPDEKAINYAGVHKGNKNVHFMVGSGTKLPFKDETFDIVVCNYVIEYTDNKKGLVREIERVLKKGGICYLSTINKLNFLPRKEPNYGDPFYYHQIRKIISHKNLEIKDITARVAGLPLLKILSPLSPSWIFILRKT